MPDYKVQLSAHFGVDTILEGPDACPHCAAPLNAHSGDRAPQPDEFSICFECAGVLRFDANRKLRATSPEETAAVLAAPGVQDVVADIKRNIQRRKAREN